MAAIATDSPRSPEGPKEPNCGQKRQSLLKKVISTVFGVFNGMVLIIVFLLGWLEVFDYVLPENVPCINNIGKCEEALMARKRYNDWNKFSDDPEENWNNLQASIKILRKVCPQAAAWVVERHDQGLLVWETEMNGTNAHYNCTAHILTLNEAFLTQDDGGKATTLAHEFRHSRQNFTKIVKSALWLMILQEPRTEIVEKDAYYFQNEVHIAIFD